MFSSNLYIEPANDFFCAASAANAIEKKQFIYMRNISLSRDCAEVNFSPPPEASTYRGKKWNTTKKKEVSLPCLSIIRQSREKAAPQIENEHDRKWIESSDQLHIIVLFLPQQHNTHGCTRLRSLLSSFIAAAALYRLVARTPNERRTRTRKTGGRNKNPYPNR